MATRLLGALLSILIVPLAARSQSPDVVMRVATQHVLGAPDDSRRVFLHPSTWLPAPAGLISPVASDSALDLGGLARALSAALAPSSFLERCVHARPRAPECPAGRLWYVMVSAPAVAGDTATVIVSIYIRGVPPVVKDFDVGYASYRVVLTKGAGTWVVASSTLRVTS